MLDCLLGPYIHHLNRKHLVPFLTNPRASAKCSAADVAAAAQQQAAQAGRQPPNSEWAPDSRLVDGCGAILGAEMGLACYGDEGRLSARRLAALFSPGSQPPRVQAALSKLLPVIQSALTLSDPELTAERVDGVVAEVQADLTQLSPFERAYGQMNLRLRGPLFPTVPGHYDDLMEELSDCGAYVRRIDGDYIYEVNHREWVEEMTQAELSYREKEGVLRRAGCTILGLMVFGPTGQLVQLITDKLKAEALGGC
jgi:hypothetical protein